jgi:hypothetical protein
LSFHVHEVSVGEEENNANFMPPHLQRGRGGFKVRVKLDICITYHYEILVSTHAKYIAD